MYRIAVMGGKKGLYTPSTDGGVRTQSCIQVLIQTEEIKLNLLLSHRTGQSLASWRLTVLKLRAVTITFPKKRRIWGPESSVQSLSHIWLFATLWTAARQASLSITNCQSLLKLMSTESVMPSNHLILYHPLQSFPASFPYMRGRKMPFLTCTKAPHGGFMAILWFRSFQGRKILMWTFSIFNIS